MLVHNGKEKQKETTVTPKVSLNATVEKCTNDRTKHKHALPPKDKASPKGSTDANKRKKRSHHRGNDDLLAIGIQKSFLPSERRVRRPFSDEEDDALLRGFERHGGAWQSIRADLTLRFEDKRTYRDLRDRFRNRWPERYTELGLKLGGSAKKALIETTENIAIAIEPSIHRPLMTTLDCTAPILANDVETPSTTPRKPQQYYPFLDPLSLCYSGVETTVPHQLPDSVDGDLEPTTDSPTTPVFLDRSIVDWARGLNSATTVHPASNGNTNGIPAAMAASNVGRRMGVLGLPLLSFEYAPPKFVDPLATWRPAGGLH